MTRSKLKIIKIARLFGQASEILWNQPMSLMHVCFDNANEQVITNENDTFVVSSARKEAFSTADDMLVELANRQSIAGTLDSCLFVTADRGLRQRLREVGAKCVGSGKWMKFAYLILCSDSVSVNVSDWMEKLASE